MSSDDCGKEPDRFSYDFQLGILPVLTTGFVKLWVLGKVSAVSALARRSVV
jgi:hypothetical protein